MLIRAGALGICGLTYAEYFWFEMVESFIFPLKIGKSSSALSSTGDYLALTIRFCAIIFADSRRSSFEVGRVLTTL